MKTFFALLITLAAFASCQNLSGGAGVSSKENKALVPPPQGTIPQGYKIKEISPVDSPSFIRKNPGDVPETRIKSLLRVLFPGKNAPKLDAEKVSFCYLVREFSHDRPGTQSELAYFVFHMPDRQSAENLRETLSGYQDACFFSFILKGSQLVWLWCEHPEDKASMEELKNRLN